MGVCMKRPMIGVIGHSIHARRIHLEVAEKIGKLIAKKGGIVVCGGRNVGVMDAVARGVKKEGGICIGILPESDLSQASEHLTIAIPTGLGYARNQIVALASDVVIVIGGGVGTLTEMAYAYNAGKPIIVIEGLDSIGEQFIGKYMDEKKKVKIRGVRTPEEAVELAFKLIEGKDA